MKVDTMMRVMRPNKIMVVKFQLKTNFDPYIDWVSSTVGGKNGKTSVLPGFSKIKRSSGGNGRSGSVTVVLHSLSMHAAPAEALWVKYFFLYLSCRHSREREVSKSATC